MTECSNCEYDLGWATRKDRNFQIDDNEGEELFHFCDFHCLHEFSLGRKMRPDKDDGKVEKFKFYILYYYGVGKPWPEGCMVDFDLEEIGKFESLTELFKHVGELWASIGPRGRAGDKHDEVAEVRSLRDRPRGIPKREMDVFRRPDGMVEVHVGDDPRQHFALYGDEFLELKAKLNSVREAEGGGSDA